MYICSMYNENKNSQGSATPETTFSSTIYSSLDLTSPVLMELRLWENLKIYASWEKDIAGVGEGRHGPG